MLENELKIAYLKISDIHPYANTARRHSRTKISKLKRLIQHFGQRVPLFVDDQHNIVDGHAVFEALTALGYEQVAVIVLTGLTPVEIKALRLALNRMSEESRWDNEKLRTEFSDLVALSFDMDLTAFDTVEIDAALNLDVPEANVIEDADAVPQAESRPASVRGDIWTCGPHRVACGDALEQEAVAALFAGETARMGFIDPPYNVPIDGFVSGLGRKKHRDFIQASGEMTEDEFALFLEKALCNLGSALIDGALLYTCIDWRHFFELLTAGRACELSLENVCVWTKTNAGMGSLYRSQHELIAVFKHGQAPHINSFGRHRSNVWAYRGMNAFSKEREDLLSEHPTVKPVALVADAIRDVTRRNDAVVDLFLGSGTTLVAAEETGRRCFGLEIDPIYVDVAIRRWQKATGKDAVRIRDGKTFSEITSVAGAEKGGSGDGQ